MGIDEKAFEAFMLAHHKNGGTGLGFRKSLEAYEAAKSVEQPVAITDDILEAVINEHDMNVPDELLASPGGFGAHREAMRAALQKIIPLTLHIEAEYKRATKRESVDEWRRCPVCESRSVTKGGGQHSCSLGHKYPVESSAFKEVGREEVIQALSKHADRPALWADQTELVPIESIAMWLNDAGLKVINTKEDL